MHVPFLVKEPGVLLCAALLLYFLLRYVLTENRRDMRLAACAFLCLAGAVVTEAIANGEGRLIGLRYDLYVYRIDQLIHLGEPGVAMGQFLLPSVWGLWFINLSYGLIAAAVMFLLIAYESRPDFREVVYAILLSITLAPLLYAAFPVSGPRFAFTGFPSIPALVAPHVIHLHDAPNGVPSVHFAIALMVWWYARRWPIGLVLGTAFVLLTGVATLASGQHYIFDLVVAVPYTIAMVAAARALHLRHGRREAPTVTAASHTTC